MLSNIHVTHKMLQECFAQDSWNKKVEEFVGSGFKPTLDFNITSVRDEGTPIILKKEIDYFSITKGVIEE